MSIILCGLAFLSCWMLEAATVRFDGATTYQTIDGFGADINHRSWNNDELKPVLDALVDESGMTLFRVVFDKTDWEATNDNTNSLVMNWDYYSQVYSSPDFQKMWDLVAYLNQKGITNGLMLNFEGNGPAWLGVPALAPGMEAEWAETIASLLVYARQTNHLSFSLVGPDNEMDQAPQGVNMTATQYTNALHKLSQLLDTNGLSDMRFVGPDLSSGGTAYMPQMLADPVVMSKVAHFGLHSYGGGGVGSAGVASYVQGSAYPDRTVWITEGYVWCDACNYGLGSTDSWSYASSAVDYLCHHLLNGVSAGLVWEGYDSQYNYYNPLQWDFLGLFGVDDTNATVKTYTRRKQYYTLAQVSKWVRPGAQRIGVSGTTSPFSPLLAFKHAGLGQVTIVGINTNSSAATLNGTLASLPVVSHLDLYYTTWTTNLAVGGSAAVNTNGAFSATIPPACVFTLVGLSGVQVAIASPTYGARFNAPAAIPLVATAETTSGGIAAVEFYSGSAQLGEVTSPPYQTTWDDVPMGEYLLTARANDTTGHTATSSVVAVTVVGPPAQIGVTPLTAAVPPGWTQQFSATASDQMGHRLDPQPAFSWSVSGGGTIDGAGLFTAGTSAGGPFDVVAASGGAMGTGSVRVAAIGRGTIGNTNAGTSADTLWSGGAWINAGRFQAGSNMVVGTMLARVGAISGGYKCAIYTDQGGNPSALLGSTTEVRSPTNGWNSFPLASSLTLTNRQYYWLAIWSDSASAKVYYSDTSSTLRWGRYNYGSWPSPITTTGGTNYDYCIFAWNGPPPALTSVDVSPTNAVLLAGDSLQFTATGYFSDGSTQDLTSQAVWASTADEVAMVSADGLCTAAAGGTTTITATLGNASDGTPLMVQVLPLAITSTSLPSGVVSVPYEATLIAEGGAAPYAWSLASGALPADLTLDASSGTISGTPTEAGTFDPAIAVSDSSSPPLRATNSFAVIVESAAEARPVIQSVGISHGIITITWTAAAGRKYRLQFLDFPTASNWDAVLPEVSATEPTATMTNAIGSASQRLYRVQVVQ